MPSSSVRLPVELLENIALEAWNLPLSAEERITLMTSLPLVNKTWLDIFIRVSSKDVHIPCASYSDQFLRILRRDSPIYRDDLKNLPNVLCGSLTFHITSDTEYATPMPLELYEDNNRMGQALASTLYAIHTLSYLPNLRRVSIAYLNWDFDDIFDQYRLIAFPAQVTNLEISYKFGPRTPSWLLGALKTKHERDECLQWSLPSIRNLRISGAGESLIGSILSACFNAETITVDAPCHLETLSPIPDKLHSVALEWPVEQPNVLESSSRDDAGSVEVACTRSKVLEEMQAACAERGVHFMTQGPY